MNIFDDDRIPTPQECITEWDFKCQLKALEQECAQRKAMITALKDIEQTMRADIVRLSNTLSQLYDLAGKLAAINPSAVTQSEHTETI